MLMWVLSYASLWLPPEGAPARVALIVLPILILVTLTNRAFGYMPIISQSTWLTDYMFLLTVHCVAHLVEYVLLQFCLRLRKAKAEAVCPALSHPFPVSLSVCTSLSLSLCLCRWGAAAGADVIGRHKVVGSGGTEGTEYSGARVRGRVC